MKKIEAIAVNRAILTGARTEKFLKASEFILWQDETTGKFWCKDPRTSLEILIPESNIDYVRYETKEEPKKPVGRPAKAS